MKKLILLCSMLFGTVFPGCKSSKYTPVDYPDMQIIFGKGGGFAGTVSEHCIFENGTVFKGTGLIEKTYEKKGKLSNEIMEQLLANLETLKIADQKFNRPGNLYSYIEIKNGGTSTTHRITWGDPQIPVSKNVQLFFNLLNHHVSNI